MDNEFMDDDGLQQARSRRRFQTGLLIVLLLFLMDSKSPESQRRQSQIAVNKHVARTVKKLEPVLRRLPHGVPFKLSQSSRLKGRVRRADREDMLTVVPELEKAPETEQERTPQLEEHAWAGLSHVGNDTIAPDKTGDVPVSQGTISDGKMSTMTIDDTEVTMVGGSFALGFDAGPETTIELAFQGLFFRKYGRLSAVVGERGDPLKVVWEAADTNAPTPMAKLDGGRLASGSSNNKSSDSGSNYSTRRTDPPRYEEVDETDGGGDGGGARKARARRAAVGSGGEGGRRLGGGMSRRDRRRAGGNGVAKSQSLKHVEIGSALGGVEAGDRSRLPGQREEDERGIGAPALAGREGAAGWSERLGDTRHLGLAAAEMAPLPDRVKLARSAAELDASLLTQVDEKGAGEELGSTLARVGGIGGAGSMRAFPVAVVPSMAVLAPGQESDPLPSAWARAPESSRSGCMFMLTLQVTETDAEEQETQNGDEAGRNRLATTMTGELAGINCDFWATVEVQFSSKQGSGQPAVLSYAVVFTMVCLLQMCLLFCRVGIMVVQRRYGRNFMIPSRFLPPKFDYHRPIPPELSEQASMQTAGGQDSEEGRDLESGNCLECAICYAAVDGALEDYMLTPCDHVFHRGCLTRWMGIKMECPTCRQELPPALE